MFKLLMFNPRGMLILEVQHTYNIHVIERLEIQPDSFVLDETIENLMDVYSIENRHLLSYCPAGHHIVQRIVNERIQRGIVDYSVNYTKMLDV